MKTISFILNNRSWKVLRPHLVVVETGGRIRIDLHKVKDKRTLESLKKFEAPCPCCGRMNKSIRFRDYRGEKGYLAVSCPTDVNYRCMRSRKCSAALQVIAEDVRKAMVERKKMKVAIDTGRIVPIKPPKEKPGKVTKVTIGKKKAARA